MRNFFNKARYHIAEYFFRTLGWPSVKQERISKVLLKKYLPPDSFIIDCGAHLGTDSIELSRIFKSATIFSFEPVESLYKKLCLNTSNIPNIHCYQLALADRCEEMDFYASEGGSNGSGSLLAPYKHLDDHPDVFFYTGERVKGVTLDKWCEINKVTHLEFLWLDMQGYEMPMLKASPHILKSVRAVHTEVSTRESYKNSPLYPEVKEFFESQGFKVVIEAIPKGWDMGNVLFVRS